MTGMTCPGLPAAWLNGWLAAVGVTVLHEGLRLRWTEGPSPVAVLTCDLGDPLDELVKSWPDRDLVDGLPIAEHWRGDGPMRRQVPVDTFASRVRMARGHRHSWVLSSTMTDLAVYRQGEVGHAPLDPSGPGTIKWLHDRLLKVHTLVPAPRRQLEETLSGYGERVQVNGLGFDCTRLGSLGDASEKYVDPVVETLAFFGLALLPVRGDGKDAQLGPASPRPVQRGWGRKTPGSKVSAFEWPAWRQPLDCAGIDALLDVWRPGSRAEWSRTGVHAAWRSVSYQSRGSNDPTAAFGGVRL